MPISRSEGARRSCAKLMKWLMSTMSFLCSQTETSELELESDND
jgi:hypothetical protein